MTWLKVLQLLLLLATRIAGTVRANILLDAGEAKATAKSIAALSQRLGIAQQVAAEVAAMSEDDLDKELKGE